MMMECPKCGFAQPRDHYCANCGVDIDNYKPQQPGFWVRLINSTYLQMALIVIAIASLVFVLLISQRHSTLLEEPGSTPLVQADEATGSNPVTAAPVAAKPPPPTERMMPPTSGEKAVVATNEPDKKNRLNSWTLHVRFAEIPNDFLNQMTSEGHNVREDNGVKSILYKWEKPLEQLKTEEPKLEWLPGSKSFPAKINETVSINFRFPADGGAEYGLMFRLRPTVISTTSLQINVDGQLLLPGENASHINVDLLGNYTLPADTIAVIAGGIPKRKLQDELLQQFRQSPLKIISSTAFIENQSEFVILIQADP